MTIITMKTNTTVPAAIVTGSQMSFQGLSASRSAYEQRKFVILLFFFTRAGLLWILFYAPHPPFPPQPKQQPQQEQQQ